MKSRSASTQRARPRNSIRSRSCACNRRLGAGGSGQAHLRPREVHGLQDEQLPLDFFFFKQKTAYEISTSDWSSDVCSSDLSTTSPSSLSASLCAAVAPTFPAPT